MKAFKCDRCHRYFDKYKLTNDMSFRGGMVEVSNGTPLDLCEDCRLALVGFMKNVSENEDDDFIEKSCYTCKYISFGNERCTNCDEDHSKYVPLNEKD